MTQETNKKALAALAIGGFGIGLTEFVIMGILPDVAQDLQISIPKAGHFIAAYALGVVVGAPLLTAVSNKWRADKILLALMVWFTIFNTLSAFSPNYIVLVLARFLSALPHGAFFGIGAVVAGKVSKPGKAAQAITVMFSGLTIANVIGVPIGTYLGHTFHWSISFLCVGVVGILTLLSLYFWMPKLEQEPNKIAGDEFKVLKKAEFWGLILLTTIGTGGFFAWYSYIAPLLIKVSGLAEDYVGWAMIVAGLGMVLGNILGGKLAEKLLPLKAVVVSLSVMVCVLVINALVAWHPIAVLVMTFTIGMVSFSVATPIQLAIIRSAKGSEMLGSSINQSAFNMGNALGAYLGGLPIALGFGFISSSLVGACMASTGIVIALVILYFRRKKELDSRNMAYNS